MTYQAPRRDKVAVWLANLMLRLATPEYRAAIANGLRLGFGVAVKEAAWEASACCYECGEEVDPSDGERHGRAGWVHHRCIHDGWATTTAAPPVDGNEG